MVVLDDIANSFVSAGLVKFKKEVRYMFEDVISPDSEEIEFDDFLNIVSANILSNQIPQQKLEDLVDSESDLSADTLLSQERRKLLMEHVVNRAAVRAWGVDSSLVSFTTPPRKLRNRKPVDELAIKYEQQRVEASDVVWELHDILKKTREQQIEQAALPTPKVCQKKKTVLLPLEELLSPQLLADLDVDQSLLADPPKCEKGNNVLFFPGSSLTESFSDHDTILSPLVTPRETSPVDAMESIDQGERLLSYPSPVLVVRENLVYNPDVCPLVNLAEDIKRPNTSSLVRIRSPPRRPGTGKLPVYSQRPATSDTVSPTKLGAPLNYLSSMHMPDIHGQKIGQRPLTTSTVPRTPNIRMSNRAGTETVPTGKPLNHSLNNRNSVGMMQHCSSYDAPSSCSKRTGRRNSRPERRLSKGGFEGRSRSPIPLPARRRLAI
eukprot:CAMPEP_0185035302 /NCGR_PEP_ID=MMETSP1103-20130426/26427_1 /TAXON_ID=36769 /ORGANISM="Paraphysomonas bandaiensis, Strain Caron Lab Isolate" /LENGTH=435 /DNA_ID=CAMNT_0027572315 /DNA_START=333 /DNA_END=1640 /DNA_ORIENTATION=-